MKLNSILTTFSNFIWFGENMKDTCHCVWGYDLNNKAYMAFEHKSNGLYEVLVIESLSNAEIKERFFNDAKNFRPLSK